MILFGVVFAILFHPFIFWAAWYLHARAAKTKLLLGSMIVLGAAGVFVGCWLYEFEYCSSSDFRVLGFPLPLAFFERNDRGGWTDYISAWGPFFLIVNFIIAAALPLVLFAAGLALRSKLTRPSRSA